MSFVVVTLLCFSFFVLGVGQTVVTIQLPNGETPNKGQMFYQLTCFSTNFKSTQSQSLAWFFNGQIVSWGEQLILQAAAGHMSVEQNMTDADLYSYLTIHEIYLTDTGNYQCSRVEGELNNFVIKASDRKIVIVNGMLQQGHYFPFAPWPICYPRVNINVLLNTETTVGCISQKGSPPVGINIFLEHGQNNLLLTGTKHDRGFAYNEEVNLKVSPEQNNARYICQIKVSGSGHLQPMNSTCMTGRIVVGLIEQKIVRIPEGVDAIFSCRKPEEGTIVWSTEPRLPASRMITDSDSTRSFVTIRNLRAEENNTVIRCKTEPPYGLQDEGKIIIFGSASNNPNPGVIPSLKSSTDTKTDTAKSSSRTSTITSSKHAEPEDVTTIPTSSTLSPSNGTIEGASKPNFTLLTATIASGSLFAIFTITLFIYLLCRKERYKITFFKKAHSKTEPKTDIVLAFHDPQGNPKTASCHSEDDSSFDSARYETENDNINELSKNTDLAYQVVDLSFGPEDRRFHTSPPNIPAPQPPTETDKGHTLAQEKTIRNTTLEGYSAPISLLPHEVYLGHTIPFDRKSSFRSSCDGILQPSSLSSPNKASKGHESYKSPTGIRQTKRRHSLDDEDKQKQVYLQKDGASFSKQTEDASVAPQYAIVHHDSESPTINSTNARIYDLPPDALSEIRSKISNSDKPENQEHEQFTHPGIDTQYPSSVTYATVHPDPQITRTHKLSAAYDAPKSVTSYVLDVEIDNPVDYLQHPRRRLSRNVPDVVPEYHTVHSDQNNPTVQ